MLDPKFERELGIEPNCPRFGVCLVSIPGRHQMETLAERRLHGMLQGPTKPGIRKQCQETAELNPMPGFESLPPSQIFSSTSGKCTDSRADILVVLRIVEERSLGRAYPRTKCWHWQSDRVRFALID